MTRISGALLMGALIVGSGPEPASAAVQSGVRYGDVVLEADPRAPVLAVSVRFPSGTADDPIGGEGAAVLLGRLLEGQGNVALAPYGAALQIIIEASELLAVLVAAPDRWQEAVSAFEDQLYRTPIPVTELDSAREELVEVIQFEAGAPVRAFDLERAAFLLGTTHRAARPPNGTLESLGPLTLGDIEAFRSLHLRPEQAIVAATGPVELSDFSSAFGGQARLVTSRTSGVAPSASEVERVDGLTRPRDAAPSAEASAPSEPLPPPPDLLGYRTTEPLLQVPASPEGSLAWSVGDRALIDLELTSTWISVAFPFPPGTPQLLLDFLVHLVVESLTPSPPDPGLYEARASQRLVDGAPVLEVTASVDPRATSRWEERLSGVFERLAAEPPDGAFFELARRRFRSNILSELAVPENRSNWLARQVALGANPALDVEGRLWGLERSAVAEAAAAAGPGRVILFGPARMMDR